MIQSLLRMSSPVMAVFLAATCLAPGNSVAADDSPSDIEELATWMTGSFSSAVQADEDPEFFAIELHLTPMWVDRDDGRWFYVEQAVDDYTDHPYRQRVYRVRELAPGLFENQIFQLPDPSAALGAWREDTPLVELEPEDLTKRDGCAIYLRKRGESFLGSTLASLCTSTLRGAAYATSEVLITADGMISWDRGYAGDGTQVWGTVKGGYVFDRIVDDSVPESVSESVAESVAESESVPVPVPVPDGSGSGSGRITKPL